MRSMGALVGVLSLGWFAWGCDVHPMCPGGEGGSGGEMQAAEAGCSLPPGGTGGGGGEPWPDGQYRDEEGLCRSERDFHVLGCAPTFDLQLADPGPCGAEHVCAGSCGDWLVVRYACLPRIGCTYDPLTRALVGVVLGDDVPEGCGETSYEVIYGDGYHGCEFTNLVIDTACW